MSTIELHSNGFPAIRPRRLRQSPALRKLVRETSLSPNDLLLPLFVREGRDVMQPIQALPGQYQWSVDKLADEVREIVSLGIPGVVLFGIPEHKDVHGSSSWNEDGVVQRAIQAIKEVAPNLIVISDVCFCEYTSHGHCGFVEQSSNGKYWVDNDKTLEMLAKQTLSLAQAGSDMLAPSGMMDGAVGQMRQVLDSEGFSDVSIMGYSAKYSSAMYGPFREAAGFALEFGDRSSYQMDSANANEALREVDLDVQEGADILMVKPALAYLDIIYRVKQRYRQLPLAAYCVSGTFAMVHAAAQQGLLDGQAVALEMLTAIKRAGADIIINYFAKDIAKLL